MPPTPAPNPELSQLVPTRDAAELVSARLHLGVLESRVILVVLELVFLVVLYTGIRWLLKRGVRRVGERLASKAPTEHQGARVRSLATVLQHTVHLILAFVFLVSALSIVGINVSSASISMA